MSNCCHKREQVMDRARRVAEEMLARRDLEPDPTCEEEPMKRYIHSIPCCCPTWPTGGMVELDGVLEALARQNQLLLDILSSVNALSAAVLSIQSRM